MKYLKLILSIFILSSCSKSYDKVGVISPYNLTLMVNFENKINKGTKIRFEVIDKITNNINHNSGFALLETKILEKVDSPSNTVKLIVNKKDLDVRFDFFGGQGIEILNGRTFNLRIFIDESIIASCDIKIKGHELWYDYAVNGFNLDIEINKVDNVNLKKIVKNATSSILNLNIVN